MKSRRPEKPMRKIRYRSGYKYQLAEEYHVDVVISAQSSEDIVTEYIELSADGVLTVRGGYA
jgi:hypothetical protein